MFGCIVVRGQAIHAWICTCACEDASGESGWTVLSSRRRDGSVFVAAKGGFAGWTMTCRETESSDLFTPSRKGSYAAAI